MLTFKRPTQVAMLTVLERQCDAPSTYPHVGSLRGEVPSGYLRDVARVPLGRGADCFQVGCDAIQQWQMFPKDLVELVRRDSAVAGVLFRSGPLWSFNPVRVAYSIRQPKDAIQRFGFANVTLPGHLACGEEHFLCEWNQATDEVWFELKADSRPLHWIAQSGRWYMRRQQARFRRSACQAMCKAVETPSEWIIDKSIACD